MSAARRSDAPDGVFVGTWAAEIIEVSALRAGTAALERAAGAVPLPSLGEVVIAPPRLTLSVRPGRWLLAGPAGADRPQATAAWWQQACQGHGSAVELSSGLAAFVLAGAAVRAMLARGCRLDLDPRVMPPGRAAATIMAQVPVILAILPYGILLLTPTSTAQHFREWLQEAARPFGQPATCDIDEVFSGIRAGKLR